MPGKSPVNEGLIIKHKLEDYGLSSKWLILNLKKYHVYIDKSEMSSMLSGTRKGTKTDKVIRYANVIILYYEKHFLGMDE